MRCPFVVCCRRFPPEAKFPTGEKPSLLHRGFQFRRVMWNSIQRKKERMEECDILEEILVEILCRLPRKSLCRFKCVSKQWLKLISDRSLVIPKTTKAGLVFHHFQLGDSFPETDHGHCRGTFLRLDNKGGASIDHSVHYNLKRDCIILDSCNGFLLLSEGFTKSPGDAVYFLYNPTTKWLEPIVPLNFSDLYRAGLVFDGNQFKVVLISVSSDLKCLVFHVYSSKDKTWRKKALDSPLGFPFDFPTSRPIKSLFFKGALHWPLLDHILIYHLQDEFCKFIEVPIVEDYYLIDVLCSYIWQFEGCLRYCQVHGDEINIWVLHMEEQNYIPGLQHFIWQQKYCGVLVPPNTVTVSPPYFFPFAFNGDFEILYIRFEESVISYNPATRKQKVAYKCLQKTENCCHTQHGGYPFSYVSD